MHLPTTCFVVSSPALHPDGADRNRHQVRRGGSLRGRSGCSDFVGTVHVHTAHGPRVYEFAWDCRWRAEQEGWTDCFGLPDQIRAAQEYDWKCFERWQQQSS